jgi:hypothetical protein
MLWSFKIPNGNPTRLGYANYVAIWQGSTSLLTFVFSLTWVSGQLARTSTNLIGPEVNDYVSLQWSSYEQPQGSNLKPQRKQTS